MTTALLSNDTELLQKAREVLVAKGYRRDWQIHTDCDIKSIIISSTYRDFGLYGLSDPLSDMSIHLTPENFDSVMEGLNV